MLTLRRRRKPGKRLTVPSPATGLSLPVWDVGKLDLPTPEQNDQIVAGDIEEMAQLVRWITRDAYVRDGWLRCVIEVIGPPDTITIRINSLADFEEELGIVVKDRRK